MTVNEAKLKIWTIFEDELGGEEILLSTSKADELVAILTSLKEDIDLDLEIDINKNGNKD
tara:strand:- start:59 stop:238 length:180 start_codon:yes stop_codon:yes gene_type:complete